MQEKITLYLTRATGSRPLLSICRSEIQLTSTNLLLLQKVLENKKKNCQIFVLPSTGFEPTPLLHCSTIRLALRPAP